jgi:hypothetical protein
MKHEIFKPSFERTDKRGIFREILNGVVWKSVNTGRMCKDSVLGNHYHTQSRLFFFMLEGRTHIDFLHADTGERDAIDLNPLEGCYLEARESHAIRFLTDGEFLLLKSEPFDPKNPDIHPLKAD